MKRILLGTTLIALAGFCGQSAHATATYVASTPVISPANGASYTLYYPNYIAHVSISVTNQYVEINGAAPSSNVTLGWQLIASEGTANQQASGNLEPMGVDVTLPMTTVMTNSSGHYRETLGPTSDSDDYGPGSYVIDTQSTIKDASGHTQATMHVTSTYMILQAN